MAYFINKNVSSEVLLPFLLQSVHQGISIIDKEMNVILMNESACQMLDVRVEDLEEDCSLRHLLRVRIKRDGANMDAVDNIVERRMALINSQEPHEIEHMRPDGRIIRIQGTPIEDGGYVTVYTDVTDQRKYEANLEAIRIALEDKLEASLKDVRTNRDLLINAINAIEDGMIVFDEQDHLVLANSRIQDLFPSIKRHLTLKSHLDDIEGFDLPGFAEVAENEGGPEGRFSSERKLHDDKWYRIDQSATMDGGRIAIFADISVYRDQTSKLQQHTTELVRMLQKEMALSETQREFVSMASHEFKTPLAIIDSNAQRILRKLNNIGPERLEERVSNIRQSVQRMQFLINRFMDFSAEEMGELKMEFKVQPFRNAIERLCLSQSELVEGANINWDLAALPDEANYDQNLMDQCVSNVISNAVKYSENGAPICVRGICDERYMRIEVEDHGVGIPDEEQSKIFRKYFRASTSSGIAGTGIGLNFAQLVLKEHGGHIEVKSKVGEGSPFTIFLPLRLIPEDQRKDEGRQTGRSADCIMKEAEP